MILSKTVQNAVLVHQKMQNKKPKIFIIAGEVSGDVLGAGIIHEMPDVTFVGVGGENMIAAGLQSIFPMGDLAVMGVVEVAGRARTLTRRISETVAAIIKEKPDIVLTIDAPGFAKSVIKKIRKMDDGKKLIDHGMRFHHFVAPQVWAWRPGRAKKYAKTFDKLYAFFDFEVPYFTAHGLDTIAVGHPLADKLIGKYPAQKTKPGEKIITLVPGSRMSEVKKLLPIFQRVAERLTAGGYVGYKFVIPTVETTEQYVRENVAKWNAAVELIPSDARYDIYAKTYIAVVASGTVSAELAMLHIPTIVVYKMNAITTFFAKMLIHTKWVSLVNILLKRTVIPEFLGTAATDENVIGAMVDLAIPANRKKMISELSSADSLWRHGNETSSSVIANDLRNTIKH